MLQSLTEAVRRSGLAQGGILLMLVLVLGQEPARGQAPAKLVVAVATTDATDKEAVEKAAKYFADLKDPKNKKLREEDGKRAKEGLPPLFPSSPSADSGPSHTVTDVVAAAAVAPVGLGEQLLSGLALNHVPPKPVEPRYRWAALKRDRDLRVLGLKPNLPMKKYWDDARDARTKGEIYYHGRFHWPIYSRPAAGGGVDFFLLVQEPGMDAVLTEKEIQDVRVLDNESGLTLFFTEAEGKNSLKAFTTAFQPGEGKLTRYMVLVSSDSVLEIARIDEVIPTGRMKMGGNLGLDDLKALHSQLSKLITR